MQRPRPDSNRGPFDPKSDAVTDWPQHTLNGCKLGACQFFVCLHDDRAGCFKTLWTFQLIDETMKIVEEI